MVGSSTKAELGLGKKSLTRDIEYELQEEEEMKRNVNLIYSVDQAVRRPAFAARVKTGPCFGALGLQGGKGRQGNLSTVQVPCTPVGLQGPRAAVLGQHMKAAGSSRFVMKGFVVDGRTTKVDQEVVLSQTI